MKKVHRTPINSRYMIGFEIELLVTKEAMALIQGAEADDWAEKQIRECGYTPQLYCHMRKVWDKCGKTVTAIIVSTYRYRKEPRDDKAEWHPCRPIAAYNEKDDNKLPF